MQPDTPCPFIDAPKIDGTTALHLAASRGLPQMAELLLSYRCNTGLANRGGVRAVELARQFGFANVVAALEQHTSNQSLQATATQVYAPV